MALALVMFYFIVSPRQALAEADTSHQAPFIRAGAIELGLAGSLIMVEKSARAVAVTRGGTFIQAPGGLAGFEIELAYAHVSSLDQLDLQGNLSWQRAWGGTSLYPYLAFGGGLRQEWLGSFRQARYPLGFSLGLRALAGQRAALRAEYRFRRILHDPVADFSEHQVLMGLSIFFKNPR